MKRGKSCPQCGGKGKYLYHPTMEELEELASYGGTTNYNPDYMKECEKCNGAGFIQEAR